MGEMWRLIRGTGRPAENMARDAAMAWAVGEGIVPPTLRLYRWEPGAVSLGYGQRPEAALDLLACARAGLAVVRRPTGGGAVLHGRDLTYAVAVPRRGIWAEGNVAACCRRIHEAVAAGLARLGAPAEVAGPRAPLGGSHGGGGVPCFAAISSHEITVGGRKLVGSAQRRFGRAILQHGSIPVAAERRRLASLLPGDSARALRLLEATMVSLVEVLGGSPDPGALAAAVAEGFAVALDVRLAEGVWDPTEEALAARLEADGAAAIPARRRGGSWGRLDTLRCL
ncbi:MAG TPA: lipoate--protein ligase family protein [Candidatus Sulfotelmatobacter sp.]|nr:lipoate--protein ligase family protein [Candidatus Sulfotelmatobacter sp.]